MGSSYSTIKQYGDDLNIESPYNEKNVRKTQEQTFLSSYRIKAGFTSQYFCEKIGLTKTEVKDNKKDETAIFGENHLDKSVDWKETRYINRSYQYINTTCTNFWNTKEEIIQVIKD